MCALPLHACAVQHDFESLLLLAAFVLLLTSSRKKRFDPTVPCDAEFRIVCPSSIFRVHLYACLGGCEMHLHQAVLLQGASGFMQFSETPDSVQLVDLFRYGNEFQVRKACHDVSLSLTCHEMCVKQRAVRCRARRFSGTVRSTWPGINACRSKLPMWLKTSTTANRQQHAHKQ